MSAIIGMLLGGGQLAHAEEPEELVIVLTGQALIKSDVQSYAPWITTGMRPLLAGDVIFTNFETAVREDGDSLDEFDLVAGSYAPPEAIDVLTDMGFNLIALSNNHSFDMGRTGILNTLRHMEEKGVAHAGIGLNDVDAAAPGYLRVGEQNVALISMASGLIHSSEAAARPNHPGLNQLHIDGAVPGIYVGYPSPEDAARILGNVREASKESLVIAYHHNHVFESDFVHMVDAKLPERFLPPAWIQGWARSLIDAGADIVVLHGAPFIQGVEIYENKPIFYGLGNFIFELHPMHDHLFGEDAWRSVIAKVEFEGEAFRGISFQPIALEQMPLSNTEAEAQHGGSRGMPALATGVVAATMLQELAERSAALGTHIEIDGEVAVFRSSTPPRR